MALAPKTPASKSKSHASVVGQWGERLVSQWLQQQGWKILARGWSSRWGELDIVALQPHGPKGEGCLAFVEVKTRSQGNWDADGLAAITLSKQKKLWKTARVFLMDHPKLNNMACRFDVALVNVKSTIRTNPVDDPLAYQGRRDAESFPPIALGEPVRIEGYSLTLHTYLEYAFELMD